MARGLLFVVFCFRLFIACAGPPSGTHSQQGPNAAQVRNAASRRQEFLSLVIWFSSLLAGAVPSSMRPKKSEGVGCTNQIPQQEETRRASYVGGAGFLFSYFSGRAAKETPQQ